MRILTWIWIMLTLVGAAVSIDKHSYDACLIGDCLTCIAFALLYVGDKIADLKPAPKEAPHARD